MKGQSLLNKAQRVDLIMIMKASIEQYWFVNSFFFKIYLNLIHIGSITVNDNSKRVFRNISCYLSASELPCEE